MKLVSVKRLVGLSIIAVLGACALSAIAASSATSDISQIKSELHLEDVAGDIGDAYGSCRYEFPNHIDVDEQGKLICSSKADDIENAKIAFTDTRARHIVTTVERIAFSRGIAVVLEDQSAILTGVSGGEMRSVKLDAIAKTFWKKDKAGRWLEWKSRLLSTTSSPLAMPSLNSADVQKA